MPVVEWASPAFEQLSALTERVAFEVIRYVDLLESFPELGVSLGSKYPELENCRQLIVGRSHRVVYEYAVRKRIVYILAVQHCRQQLPTAREVRRGLRHPVLR
jgi:plasmid stabilization system protein ParE